MLSLVSSTDKHSPRHADVSNVYMYMLKRHKMQVRSKEAFHLFFRSLLRVYVVHWICHYDIIHQNLGQQKVVRDIHIWLAGTQPSALKPEPMSPTYWYAQHCSSVVEEDLFVNILRNSHYCGPIVGHQDPSTKSTEML